jgi:hypothetical protein
MSYWNGAEWVPDQPDPPKRASRRRRVFGATFEATLIVALTFGLIAGTAFAAKGGGTKGGGKPATAQGTIALVVLDSTDGQAHHGQTVTFAVATSATDRPYVSLNCYQDGVWVLSGTAGFYPDYPWDQSFVLANDWFTGAGDCTAQLYSNDSRRSTTLATMTFHVYP